MSQENRESGNKSSSRKILFLCGGWEGHQPLECVALVAPRLESAGCEATVMETLEPLEDLDRLRGYDVIVPAWTMGVLSDKGQQNLVTAVRSGVGLAGWHGGMGDAFRSAADYQFMVGGQFVAHPAGLTNFEVTIGDRSHPISEGIESFTIHTEQYYMHVDPSNRVLATTTFSGENAPWIAGCRMPVVWTRSFGAGRVFYCSLGHQVSDLGVPRVGEIIHRGILWAARALRARKERR